MKALASIVILFKGLIAPALLLAQQPLVKPGGIVNGASFKPRVAPGSIASVFGNNLAASVISASATPLPTILGGTTVTLSGLTGPLLAPLFYVSPSQINFQVPWELTGQSQASLTVTVGGSTSNPVTVALANFAPGIFVANSSGQGAILNADSASIAAPSCALPGSQPVVPGRFISIYATGLGPVANQPATGATASDNPLSVTTTTPTVTIGSVSAPTGEESQFSGLAPASVGLYQINVQVPQDAPTGDAIQLTVSIGGVTSNTVAVAVASGNHYVDLTWTASTTGGVSYNVYCRLKSNPTPIWAGSTVVGMTNFTHYGVQGGQSYLYQVTAVDPRNPQIESGPSNIAEADVPSP